MKQEFIATIAFIFLLCVLAFAVGYWAAKERYAPPNCPLEDSCHPEYENGQWYIVEGNND